MFLFEMTNGKQKLAYGATAQDAFESLRLRLSDQEMQLVLPDKYIRIPQRELQKHVHNLG
ncbi:MAG: hypothetical protein EYC68_09360 [Chloroflexota bacterium]|nr:MAG: hypothetical protein EYC68_09360 [Chloroflexota bacterium]